MIVRRATRRGALAALMVATGLVGAMAPRRAALAQSDRDTQPGQPSGFTDRDRGKTADPVGNGRGTAPSTMAVTDSDAGAAADPVNMGRGGIGLGSDSDEGPDADPTGGARRPPQKR